MRLFKIRKCLLIWGLIHLVFVGVPTHAQEVQSAESLPVFEVVPEALHSKEGVESKVGDELSFRIKLPSGSDYPESKEVKIDWQAAQSEMEEKGWAFRSEGGVDKPGVSVKLIPLKPGTLTFPSISILDKKGVPLGKTQNIQVEVASAIASQDPKPAQPEGLAPPVGLPFPLWMVVLSAVIILGVLFLCTYLIYRWIKKRVPKKAVSVEAQVPEDEMALVKLEELEKSGLLAQALFKAFYFRLSEILKEYIGARFEFNALESTTREMIQELKEKVSEEDLQSLLALFEKLDRVKFTDFRPIDEEAHDLLGRAKVWIRKTKSEKAPSLLQPHLTESVKKNTIKKSQEMRDHAIR